MIITTTLLLRRFLIHKKSISSIIIRIRDKLTIANESRLLNSCVSLSCINKLHICEPLSVAVPTKRDSNGEYVGGKSEINVSRSNVRFLLESNRISCFLFLPPLPLPLPLVVEGSPAEGFEEEEDESNDPMESLPPIKANDSEQM